MSILGGRQSEKAETEQLTGEEILNRKRLGMDTRRPFSEASDRKEIPNEVSVLVPFCLWKTWAGSTQSPVQPSACFPRSPAPFGACRLLTLRRNVLSPGPVWMMWAAFNALVGYRDILAYGTQFLRFALASRSAAVAAASHSEFWLAGQKSVRPGSNGLGHGDQCALPSLWFIAGCVAKYFCQVLVEGKTK